MKNEVIAPLEKNRIHSKDSARATDSGCCGGAPEASADACCKLDESMKAEGEKGCGCNTAPENTAACC